QPRRIDNVHNAVIDEFETTDLVGSTEAILHAPHQPQGGVFLALELQHHVDEMFQQSRACHRSLLGDVPHQDHREVTLLGQGDQTGGDRADLRHATGRPLGLRGGHGLYRVDYEHSGVDLVHVCHHRTEIALGREIRVRGEVTGSFGPQPYLT